MLDAAFLPSAPGYDASLILFPSSDMTPGAWRRAEEAMAIPETARRLTLPIGDPTAPRMTATRALPIWEAVPYLIGLGAVEVRPSVRAWQLVAHIVRRLSEGAMQPRGDATTEAHVERLVKAMPPSGQGVLVDLIAGADDDPLARSAKVTEDDDTFIRLSAREAVDGFVQAALLAHQLGLETQVDARRVAGRSLVGLSITLVEPTRIDAVWLARIAVDDGVSVDRRDRMLADVVTLVPTLSVIDGTRLRDPVELSIAQAGAVVRSIDELARRGARMELPSVLANGLDPHIAASVRLGGRKRGGRATGITRFRLDDLIGFNLEVALGGVQVDASELRRIARESTGLVHLQTGWLAVSDSTKEQLEKLARAVENHDATMANARALNAALAGVTSVAGINATVEHVEDPAITRALDWLRSPTEMPDVEPGPLFTGELRPYQVTGLRWLAGMADLPLGACLADDMGLGKTVQVIALLAYLKERIDADADATPLRVLVTCPTSLIGNWEREIARFCAPLDVYIHHGPQRTTNAEDLTCHEVVLTSYGLVARDRDMLGEIDFDVLVFDEAQAVKNPDTEQARAVRLLRGAFRVALTGTPIENRLLELWAILDLLNPGLLGTAGAFTRRFALPIERASSEEAATTLRTITRPFVLRRVKHDPTIVPDLPAKQEHTVTCTLTTEQAALYREITTTAMEAVRTRGGIGRRGAVLALLTRLKQICNHPAQMLGQPGPIAGRSGKLERLESMLEEVAAEGDRALVFTQYAQMGNLLAAHLPEVVDAEVLYLHGGVPRPQREALIQRFQASEDGKPLIFILSLRTGGLGLNLMQASHVFHYDRWWNPAVEDQATDRTHRIGQTRQIQVHKMVCVGTLEERIASIIEEKRTLAGRVIDVTPGAGEGWVTELGDDELQALIELDETRVEIGHAE